jgi:hypothetical protein
MKVNPQSTQMLKDEIEKKSIKKNKKPKSTELTCKTHNLSHEIMIIS